VSIPVRSVSNRPMGAPRLALLVTALLLASACGSDASPTVPSRNADIAGRVTAVTPSGNFRGTVLVEANPSAPNGDAKALVTVASNSIVLTVAGTEGEFRSLALGQWVRVWFTGPVLESYPVQGTAATVKIDSAGVSVVP
jgi:hypothetical protein